MDRKDNWIPVKENLPDDTDNVLVSYGGTKEKMQIAFYIKDADIPQWAGVPSYVIEKITHWQPLPSPPNQ